MLKYEIETRKFSELRDKIEIPKFQRGLVWGQEKKKRFIRTLKDGLPIGALLLSEKNEKGKYLVIDGLQRFSTMVDYSNDYFRYLEASEITDENLARIIAASSDAETSFSAYTDADKIRVRDEIRGILVSNISKMQQVSAFDVALTIARELCKTVAIFPDKDEKTIASEVYKYIDTFQKNASIDDITIPLIIFKGKPDELASIYQALNQEGVKLTKYDVFAATWVDHTIFVKNDTQFIELITKKYDIAEDKSGLEISGYDADEMKSTGELTVFEYAFGIGKALQKACPKLFSQGADDAKIETMGFLILTELVGLSYSNMVKLADVLDEFKAKVNFKELKDAIIECCKEVFDCLETYITAPTKQKTSLACHSDLQLASFIITIFKLKYDLTRENGLRRTQSNHREITAFKTYLPKHYLYDILREHWSASGDTKLENIIAKPTGCRYLLDAPEDGFRQTIIEWLHEANSITPQLNIKSTYKLFLNYFLRLPSRAIIGAYDIEHCVPQNVIKKFFLSQKIDVPMSTVCNLVYIPYSDNRSKGDRTYYQDQAMSPDSAYPLDEKTLVDLGYPSKQELQFVESADTLTKENYEMFLREREKLVTNLMMGKLYP